MEGNLLSFTIRKNYIDKCSREELDKYFRDLKKIADQRGGYFKDIYKNDINYLNQKGGKAKIDHENLHKISNLADKNTLCSLITQNNLVCQDRAKVLSEIYTSLEKGLNKDDDKDWKKSIQRFFEFLACCSDYYSDDRFAPIRKTIIVPITNLIISNIKYTNFSSKIIDTIIHNENNRYVSEYANIVRRRYRLLNSGVDIYNNYEANKEYVYSKLQEIEMFKKYGFGNVFFTKIVEEIRMRQLKNINLNIIN